MLQHHTGGFTNEHTHSIYGAYKDEQAHTHLHDQMYQEQPSFNEKAGEKVYASPSEQKNRLRFKLVQMSMCTIIACAVLCTISGVDAVGWVGVGLISFAVFLITIVAIEKIQ